MFKTLRETCQWLDKMEIDNYQVDNDFTVNVGGEVNLFEQELTHLPVKFGRVKGNFAIQKTALQSLVGLPHTVENHFMCEVKPELNFSQYAPQKIGGSLFLYGELSMADLHFLSTLNLGEGFSHHCQNEKEKIIYFKEKYLQQNNTLVLNLNVEEFQTVLKIQFEKEALDAKISNKINKKNSIHKL